MSPFLCILVAFLSVFALSRVDAGLYVGKDSGLVIDLARIQSTWFVRDEYVYPDQCDSISTSPYFRRILRFDFAIQNLGSTDFFSTTLHPQDACSGVSRFQNFVDFNLFDSNGGNLPLVTPSRGMCLEDTQVASGTPSGTAAAKANYTCRGSTQGISVGWASVISAETDMMAIDLGNLADVYPNPSSYVGKDILIQIIAHPKLLGNWSDIEANFTFTMPYDVRCYPAPQYVVKAVSTPQWTDPVANSHTKLSFNDNDPNFPTVQVVPYPMSTFTFDNTLFCGPTGSSIYVKDNGIVSFNSGQLLESGNPALVELDNTYDPTTSSPYYLGNTIFPYWDAYYYINSSYSSIYIDQTLTDLIVTWFNVDRIQSADRLPITYQLNFFTNGSVLFNYKTLPATGSTFYVNGKNASIGLCAGLVNSNYSAFNLYQQYAVDNNCLLYSILTAGTVKSNFSVLLDRVASVGRTYGPRPVVNITGVTNGQINSTYTFSANSSAVTAEGTKEVVYMWIWGDGSSPSFGVSVNHTYNTVGVYYIRLRIFDGLQFSQYYNYTVYMGPIILNNGTKTGTGDGDGEAGYIAIAVILPILFVMMLIIMVTIFVFVFLRRHILSSGGAWWGEDPIYLNLDEQA